MKFLLPKTLCTIAIALALPMLGHAAAVQLNGVCINGNCLTPNPVVYGSGVNQSGTASTSLVLGTDAFQFGSSFDVGVDKSGGTFIDFYPTVTYVGNAPSTSKDTITVNLLASIYDSSAVDWNGTYQEHVPLLVAAKSTASGQLFADGESIGLIGPYGPGSWDLSKSATFTDLTGPTLNYDFQLVFTFGKGTRSGAEDLSPASSSPEPAQLIPSALALCGLAFFAARRRKCQ